jgi:nucleotide-binding universal stress UspA family protein
VEKRKFLVIVDPAHEKHLALERMLDIIRQRREWVLKFHLLIGAEPEDKADPNAPHEVIYSRDNFNELLNPLDELGVDYTTEFFWTRDWRKSIAEAGDRYECDTIMLSESSAEHKTGITDSKWALVRQAKSDVVIVDEGTSGPIKCILAAVNTQVKDEAHTRLNEKILERGKFLSEYFEADFENIHRDMGKPEDVIAGISEKLNADMVILGISPRQGIAAKFSSHTTEKVMEKITVDVVAIN